ncbi:uncharacterized protein LOC132041757 isoform X2 [Lycium ferocissimum]|uniref:uncharacterized protein LOC132041757 isoform X2 n=1 Tax=Lycium ferocissimum TaxID=112874 RepID=UPI0028155986|nr:uncharacterized protein LOC132041757 isoform X2 [Lycium ferocissimum]
MASLKAQRLLELAILDYMSKRGYHQIREAFSPGVPANQNPFAINFPHEAFLQELWGKFYEAYSSRFPDDPVFAAESFDKVAQTLEDIVANQSFASDHTGLNISNVMPSPVMESSGPDLMDDARISDLMSRDMPPILQSLEMNEMDGMLPFASNAGYQMPIVPPEWNARDDRHAINLGGPTQMEPNIHAPATALPASPELSDAGNNGYLQLSIASTLNFCINRNV